MTSSPTLPEIQPAIKKSSFSRHGVLTLYGYGIDVRVDRGHLVVKDGIAADRYQLRLSRVGHNLRRLVVIGNDGQVSLAALRWLSDQKCAFVLLERDGRVLLTTGPVRSSDARLRRAQALAEQSGAALVIARELISRKLAGQERVARDKLLDERAAEVIAGYRAETERCASMDAVRWLETKGASAYFSAWRNLPISFPKNDLRRVPDHWRTFDTRKSPLTGSQRLAVCPINAILNFCYALAEAEARLAAATLGLDTGLAFLHMDAPARDSLACDLMEPVRPEIDAFILDLVTRNTLKRDWFHEERDGNCRLMAPFAVRVAETAPIWARSIAAIAEWVARQLWTRRRDSRETGPATRLTQSRKRKVKGNPSTPQSESAVKPQRLCRACGKEIGTRHTHCLQCATPAAAERLRQAAQSGRIASHAPEARRKQGNTQRQHRQAQAAWPPASQPDWLTEEFFAKKVQPKLARVATSLIASQLGVSWAYAVLIRKGYRPHPRHWQALAEMVGISEISEKAYRP